MPFITSSEFVDLLWKVINASRLFEAASRLDLHLPAICQRTNVDQNAAWRKHASDFIQGMDHARRGNSSE